MSNLVPSLTRQYLRADQHLTYLCCRAPPEEAGGPARFLWMYALAFLAAAMLLQVQRARPAQEEAEADEALEFFPGPAWHALEVGEMDEWTPVEWVLYKATKYAYIAVLVLVFALSASGSVLDFGYLAFSLVAFRSRKGRLVAVLGTLRRYCAMALGATLLFAGAAVLLDLTQRDAAPGCTWGNVVFGESEGTRFGSLFRRHATSIVVLAALHAQTQLHASNLHRRVAGCRGRDSAVVGRFVEGFELLSAKQCEASLQAREERQRRARRLAWLKENLVEPPADEPGAWDDFALRAERQASEELGADGADEYQDAVSELGPSLAASRRPSREAGLSTAVDLGTFPVTPKAPSLAASRSRTPSLTPDEEAPLSLGSDVKSTPEEKRGGAPGGTPGSVARRALARGAKALQNLRHRSLDSDSPLVYLLVGVYFAADFTVASSLALLAVSLFGKEARQARVAGRTDDRPRRCSPSAWRAPAGRRRRFGGGRCGRRSCCCCSEPSSRSPPRPSPRPRRRGRRTPRRRTRRCAAPSGNFWPRPAHGSRA